MAVEPMIRRPDDQEQSGTNANNADINRGAQDQDGRGDERD